MNTGMRHLKPFLPGCVPRFFPFDGVGNLCLLVLLALLGGCGILPPLEPRTPTMALAPDPAGVLSKTVAASTPPGEDSGFRLLPLGVYSLDARIQLVQRAQRSLDLQYYVLDN